MMASESTPPNGTWTTKEMWLRVDTKLDALLAKQNHYDVELALLSARVKQAEDNDETVKNDLKEAERIMDAKVSQLIEGQVTLARALKWATATVIGAGVILDAILRFYR